MLKVLLPELCMLDGVSGREATVRSYILQKLQESTAEKDVTVDAMGNVLVRLFGEKPANNKVLFDAHMDEVGFLITDINNDGTLCFEPVGGIDASVLFGHKVRIGNVLGIIGGKAIHHCVGEEKMVIPSMESLTIDIGALDELQAKEQVSVGQWGTFYNEFSSMHGDFFTSKAVDNRVGCALLLELASKRPLYDLWLSFSVQEEVGLRGAKVVGEAIQPDIAVAIDATTAADTVGSDAQNCVCKVGQGAVVSFADGATLYDVDLYQTVRTIADKHGIPSQTKNRVAGGNNAGAIQRSSTGVRMAAVSLPCRYIHSPACVGNWRDVQAMRALLHALAKELPL